MSIGLSGIAILADRLELIQTIARNIAGTSETPDTGDLKTQPTSALPDDPVPDGFIRKNDRTAVSADSAGRERAALLSSMMQALRPPIAGPGQISRQAWNAALAQPLAELAQVDSAHSNSDLPLAISSASESEGEIPYREYSRVGDTLVLKIATDFSTVTHTATDFSGLDLESSRTARTELDSDAVQPAFQFDDTIALQPDQPDAKIPAAIVDAAKGDRAIAEAMRTPLASRADGVETAMISRGESTSSALASKTADASLQADLILKALGELDLGSVAAGIAPMATERAGVLASFVLNAHFLPGWPPARPIESLDAKALVNTLAQDKTLSKSDIELLTYLANFGVSREHLEKLLKALKRAAKRPGLLRALVCFLTNLSATLRALGTEVDAIITDLTLEEQLQVRHGSGNRRRIDLG